MSAFFEIRNEAEWEALKQNLPLVDLGGQHILSMLNDVETTRSLHGSTANDLHELNKLKQLLVEKVGENSHPQDILDAITTSPIVVADMKDTISFKTSRLLSKITLFPTPKRYKWLLGMNLAAVALCKDYLEQCRVQGLETEGLTISAIVVPNNEVTAEKIISASTSALNMSMAASFEDSHSSEYEANN